MDKYGEALDRRMAQHWNEYYYATRKWVYLARMFVYDLTFRLHFRLGFDFTWARPGLEVKYACESAEKIGANLSFMGPELNPQTWKSLRHETRFNLPDYLLRRA